MGWKRRKRPRLVVKHKEMGTYVLVDGLPAVWIGDHYATPGMMPPDQGVLSIAMLLERLRAVADEVVAE